MGEKFKSESGDSEKTDWSFVDKIAKKRKEEERSKMTPEELAEDDRKKKQAEETQKWFERSKKIEQGDPEAIAEFEEEKRQLHERIWKGSETAKAEEEKTPEKIDEAKRELEEKYEESGLSDEKESPDQKAAREIIESGQNMSLEDLLSFSLQVYKKIKDNELREETYRALSEMAKQKSQERLQSVKKENEQVVEDFKAGKITKEAAERKLGIGKKLYSWEKKKKYSWEK